MENYRIEPYTKSIDELIGGLVVPEEVSQGTDGLRYINTTYALWCAGVAMEIDRIIGKTKGHNEGN